MMQHPALRILGCAALLMWAQGSTLAKPQAFDLTPRLRSGDAVRAAISLKVGGELLITDAEGRAAKLPMSVAAQLTYDEQLLAWVRDEPWHARSLRRYAEASAAIKVDDAGVERGLSEGSKLIAAAYQQGRFAINGLDEPLDRDQLDLVRAPADTLTLDRLLPSRRVAQGERWEHPAEVIAALLGLDHVAMCDVRSSVLGVEHGQVKLKLEGKATGSVDGAATEIELQAAYLYHIERGRITKFNLALKERRKPGQVTPGLDVIAKLSLTVKPINPSATLFAEDEVERAGQVSMAEMRQLAFSSPRRGCRFRHADDWYLTAVQPDLLSLRLLQEGDMLAHCNVRTLPVRIATDQASVSLAEFEADIRRSLGKKLREVASATEWESPAGNLCLGVFVDGQVDHVPMQWRYYLISKPGKPQISVSVSVEKSQLGAFADADRILVDSLELLDPPSKKVAKSPAGDDRDSK